MQYFRYFLSILLILLFASHGSAILAGQKPKTKSDLILASKKVGFSGDPSRKRGMEIGFDQGKKAGKVDKEQDLKPDLKRHEAYQKPETFFRSEYGSQASFVAGFRSGFSGGYQAAFGKKVPMSPDGSLPKSDMSAPTTAPKKGVGSASDAL